MKYIEIDPHHLEDYVDILLGLVVGINPHIDEYTAKSIMITYLKGNRLTEDAALELGDLISHTCAQTKKPMDN